MQPSEIHQVQEWFEQAVLGLGLCPFAAEPWQAGRIHFQVSRADSEPALVEDLRLALKQLEATTPQSRETTILIVTNLLADFGDYNQFLNVADDLLIDNDWEGEFQVASFHPHYQFADTEPADVENLTNRSPYPLLHLLRESSVTKAVDGHPDPERIPEDNIATLRSLSEERRRKIFGFLDDQQSPQSSK